MQFCLYLCALDLWESKQGFLIRFTALPSTTFAQMWPSIVFTDYFRCFRGLEKGFSEKGSCKMKCLFADHRAIRTLD